MTGLPAAEERVAALFDRLSRTNLDVVVVSRRSGERAAALGRAREAALVAGRGDLMAEATRAAREGVLGSFARGGFSGTWAVAEWGISIASADDRVAAAEAFEEAAAGAVAADLVDERTLDQLTSTADGLADVRGLPRMGALSELTAGLTDRRRRVWAAVAVVAVLGGLFAAGPLGIGLVIAATASIIVVARRS